MTTKAILLNLLALVTLLGTPTWDKAPEKWDLKDVYRILQDSPWSPAESKLVEGEFATGEVDPLTGVIRDRSNPNPTARPVPGIRLHHNKRQPAIPVLWWSSKTIRLAVQRLRQLNDPARPTGPLRVEELPVLQIWYRRRSEFGKISSFFRSQNAQFGFCLVLGKRSGRHSSKSPGVHFSA